MSVNDSMTATEKPSYTVGDLEEETGFDRRTIAYYVQEGLLPRVGRRGPRTRYPRLVRDRLLFVRRVREAEEAGTVPPVSLSEMRKIFERMAPSLVAGVADGRIAVTPELVGEASTALRMPEMRRAGKRRMALTRRMESRLMEAEGPMEAEGSPAYGPSVREPVADVVADAAPDYEGLRAPPVPEDVEARPRRSAEARRAHMDPGEAPEAGTPPPQAGRRRRHGHLDQDRNHGSNGLTSALSVRGLIVEDDRKLANLSGCARRCGGCWGCPSL